MAIESTRTAWGYAITCTSGTAVATEILAKGSPVRLLAIACGGSATTDIVTVNDANGVQLFKAAAPAANSSTVLSLPAACRVDGLQVGVAGGTAGRASIFLE